MIRLAIALLACGLFACRPSEPRELETLEVQSPPLAAGPVLLDVDMPGGQLEVRGDFALADRVTATLQFDHPEMKPELAVAPKDEGSTVTLTANWREGIGPTTNLWTVTLPGGRPVDLDLHMGVGRLVLAPFDVTLRSVTVRQNYGEALVDLSRTTWEGTLTVSVEIGSGPQVRVVVPDDAGVRLRAVQSVGSVDAPSLAEQDDDSWVGAGFAERARRLELAVRVGTGDVVVRTAREVSDENGGG